MRQRRHVRQVRSVNCDTSCDTPKGVKHPRLGALSLFGPQSSLSARLRRAIFLVDPLAAPSRAQGERPLRAGSELGVAGVADHDHLRRVTLALSHCGSVFMLFPVQAFSALCIQRSGYVRLHRGSLLEVSGLGSNVTRGAVYLARLRDVLLWPSRRLHFYALKSPP